jgi:PadR family transcriptional regulator, regulatory protein PadR
MVLGNHGNISSMERGLSLATLRVLRAFCDDPSGDHYGLELSERSRVKAGALYPILARLESTGWIEGTWEDIDERAEGRRRRRYYRLTGLGERAAWQVLAETAQELAPPPRQKQKPPLRPRLPAPVPQGQVQGAPG